MNSARLPSLALLALAGAVFAQPQLDATMTYQARVNDNGAPANGLYDVVFRLYDAPVGGNLVAGPVAINDASVNDGLLTVEVDFGLTAFDNSEQWMEIDVDGQTLSPRQALTRTPYAMQMRGVTSDENRRVGIGVAPDDSARLRVWTDNPNLALDVLSFSGDGINATTSLADGYAIRGLANGNVGLGVIGEHTQTGNRGWLGTPLHGVEGLSTAHTGAGVFGSASGSQGFGGYFESTHELGVGVYGIQSSESA